VIYPILVYGVMVLPQVSRTENAAVGIPVREMFRYTLTNPFFLLMITMMAITTSLELGPMRWVPAVLQAGGLHGILVLVWISGWMVVLRRWRDFVERLAPTGAADGGHATPTVSEFRTGHAVRVCGGDRSPGWCSSSHHVGVVANVRRDRLAGRAHCRGRAGMAGAEVLPWAGWPTALPSRCRHRR
jgi:hypothetical protein